MIEGDPRVFRVARYISPEGVVCVGHVPDALPQPARLYLGRNGIGIEELDQLFAADGTLVGHEQQENIYGLSPTKFDGLLRRRLAPVYSLVDRSLAPLRPGGFNLHGEPHIDNVTAITVRLLESAGANTVTIIRGIAAARGHDLGNLLSREDHALLSPEIFRRLVPEIESKPENWEIIRRAILLHDIHDARLMELTIPGWETMSAEEKITAMSEFGPEANALIIADKTDIGRQRVNPLPFDTTQYDIDPNAEVNLLGVTKKVKLSNSRKKLIWELGFVPGMTPEEVAKFPHFGRQRSNHPGLRARASAATQAVHRSAQIPHFDIWQSLVWQLYLPKIERSIISAFALFPNVQEVEIRMLDQEDHIATEVIHHVAKEHIDPFVESIRTRYIPKEKRRSGL